jgi:CRP/FNR family transcriptional regulator
MPLTAIIAGDLLQGMTEPEREKFAAACAERRYHQGATIFSRGDTADSLYIVKEGSVRILSLADDGTETIVHILKPGEIFGELLLSEEKRALTATAGSDVQVTVLSKGRLVELLSAIPALAKNYIRFLSRRLVNVERHFVEFGHTWSYHRLARTLLKLCADHGRETPEGTVIPLRLTHEDLANLIGTTRETVTTQLNRFRRMKLVKRQDRFLVVHRTRLEEFARQETDRSRTPG